MIPDFDLTDIMKNYREQFLIFRNGTTISTVDGYRNSEKSPPRKYIGLYPNTDVQERDILKSRVSDEEFYVVETAPHVIESHVFQKKAYYLTDREFRQQRENTSEVSTVFNIQNASGSIIGTQQVATLNFNTDLQKLKEQIDLSNSPDKDELNELISQLKAIIDGTQPAQRGGLARFSETMQRNMWVTAPLGAALIKWLTHHI